MTVIITAIRTASKRLNLCSDSPTLDAEVLLCHVLQKQRTYLKTWPEQKLTAPQLQSFHELLEKRCSGYPIAYITGTREFWSREFIITPDVLIPRPETERLIELSLNLIPDHAAYKGLDLGTGSGAIAITLAAEKPTLAMTATDFSAPALLLAQRNAQRLGVKNIQFQISRWFNNINETHFDIIVSNPPYIAKNDLHLQQGDVRFEPDCALISEHDGLADITLIAASARHYLRLNGLLLIEHGYNQQEQVHALFKRYNYSNIQTHLDLSGQPRVTTGQRR